MASALPLSCVALASKGVGDEEKRGKVAFFSHPLAFCVFNADYFCLKALKIVDVFSVLYIVLKWPFVNFHFLWNVSEESVQKTGKIKLQAPSLH